MKQSVILRHENSVNKKIGNGRMGPIARRKPSALVMLRIENVVEMPSLTMMERQKTEVFMITKQRRNTY